MKGKNVIFAFTGSLVLLLGSALTYYSLAYPTQWVKSSLFEVKRADSENSFVFDGEGGKLIVSDAHTNRFFLVSYKKKEIYLINSTDVLDIGSRLRTKKPLAGSNITSAKFDHDGNPVFSEEGVTFNTAPDHRIVVRIISNVATP